MVRDPTIAPIKTINVDDSSATIVSLIVFRFFREGTRSSALFNREPRNERPPAHNQRTHGTPAYRCRPSSPNNVARIDIANIDVMIQLTSSIGSLFLSSLRVPGVIYSCEREEITSSFHGLRNFVTLFVETKIQENKEKDAARGEGGARICLDYREIKCSNEKKKPVGM